MTEPVPQEMEPIARLHVLKELLPGACVVERVIDAPFAQTWDYVADLAATLPLWEPVVRRAEVALHEDDRAQVTTWGWTGRPTQFDAVIRPGWCLMQSRRSVIVMAAQPRGDATLFGHLEALRLPGSRWFGRLTALKMRRELDRLAELAVQNQR